MRPDVTGQVHLQPARDIYGVFAAAVLTQIVSRSRIITWLRRTFAMAFVGLEARLAITER